MSPIRLELSSTGSPRLFAAHNYAPRPVAWVSRRLRVPHEAPLAGKPRIAPLPQRPNRRNVPFGSLSDAASESDQFRLWHCSKLNRIAPLIGLDGLDAQRSISIRKDGRIGRGTKGNIRSAAIASFSSGVRLERGRLEWYRQDNAEIPQ